VSTGRKKKKRLASTPPRRKEQLDVITGILLGKKKICREKDSRNGHAGTRVGVNPGAVERTETGDFKRRTSSSDAEKKNKNIKRRRKRGKSKGQFIIVGSYLCRWSRIEIGKRRHKRVVSFGRLRKGKKRTTCKPVSLMK